MHTFKSVMDKVGPEAQIVGGSVIILQDGKHVLIGRVAPETGSFTLTPEGLAVLNAPDVSPGEEAEAPAVAKGVARAKVQQRKPLADAGDLSGSLGDISFGE